MKAWISWKRHGCGIYNFTPQDSKVSSKWFGCRVDFAGEWNNTSTFLLIFFVTLEGTSNSELKEIFHCDKNISSIPCVLIEVVGNFIF